MRLSAAASDSGVKAGPVVDGAAYGGGELIGGDLLVAVGVHVPQQRVEQCALPRSDGLSCRGIDGMAEGAAQPVGQLLIVVALPHAVPVGVDDGEAALQHGPFTGGERARPAVSSLVIIGCRVRGGLPCRSPGASRWRPR